MYIWKNALRNITRQKGRTTLIFILIVTIAFSSCVALCIQSSADKSKESAYENMLITATITPNQTGMMNEGFGQRGEEEFDRDAIKEEMMAMQVGLSIEELQEYAQLEEVSSFYFTRTIGLDGTDIEAYEISTNGFGESQMGGKNKGMMTKSSGDFEVTSFSNHDAMSNFVDGTCIIYDGTVFDIDDSASCVISQELAYLNDIAVGDSIELVNPNLDSELYEIQVVGIFSCETTDMYANHIYISEDYYQVIYAYSNSLSETIVVEDQEMDTVLSASSSGIYTFETVEDYESFSESVVSAGLDTESYSVVSNDISEFESSITPLENLTTFTMYFFIVVLVIGSAILILFNIFTIRERKYEIGVLAAIGMPKLKVAQQFIYETFMITIVAIVIGGIGGMLVASPVAESLLENQVEAMTSSYDNVSNNFGGNFQGQMQGMRPNNVGTELSDIEYVDTIEVSIDNQVIIQLLGVALVLSVVASSVGVVSVLRYDPLTILANRS